MKERRRFPRYNCSLDVDYSTQGIASVESRAQAQDISKVGIRIPISRIIKRGSLLRLDIRIEKKTASVPAVGRVIWAHRTRNIPPLTVLAGIEFTDIEPSEIDSLISSCQ